MKSATILKNEIGTHQLQVTGSNPVAATTPLKSSVTGRGFPYLMLTDYTAVDAQLPAF
jgi:hypothetical protein